MKIITIFPKDAEALFDRNSSRTFGGADLQMYLITRELATHEDVSVSSFIVNYDNIDFDESQHFDLIRTFRENDFILSKIYNYHRHIKKLKPDFIIQRGLSIFSCFLALYCRLFSVKYVFMFAHDIESEGRYQSSKKKCIPFPMLLRHSYRLIVQNEYEFNNLRKYKVTDKSRILKKGLDLFRTKKSAEKTYDSVWIGRCEEWKRPEVFIELAGRHKNHYFLMVCSPVRGREEYFRKIKREAFELDNIEFLEFVPNEIIYDYLARSSTFCITSDLEGDWPMTVLEAAASALPILSFKLSYGNLFEKYNGGYFCNNSLECLTESLSEVLTDRSVYREKSRGAFMYILDNHEIKINVRKLLDFLKD